MVLHRHPLNNIHLPMNALFYDHVDLVLPMPDIALAITSLMRGEQVSRSTASEHPT